MTIKNCGQPDHDDTQPWMACPHCRATSTYAFGIEGGTPKFHRDIGDLPPSDEVTAQKREAGHRFGEVSGESEDEASTMAGAPLIYLEYIRSIPHRGLHVKSHSRNRYGSRA